MGDKLFRTDFFHLEKTTIVISDVHCSLHWKDILRHRTSEDRVIFLGDYFDRRGMGPFAENATENFLEICNYARNNPDTHLLVGNHDLERLCNTSYFLFGGEEEIRAIQENMDILDMIFVDKGKEKPCIFSHGGVCETFMRINALEKIEDINIAWHETPMDFDFIPIGVKGERSSPDGDNPWQSPLWARFTALTIDGIAGCNQVVGHTPIPGENVPTIFTTGRGDSFLGTCTFDDTLIRLD